ncbi:MAG: cobyrinate a,c-diamide synthase [Clostridia bacterium]|nr:cobyrinate a,c-diamide synthase [Clostridia bacterium]
MSASNALPGAVTRPAPRVMIAGTGSGCGKTTAVCAILQALKDRGLDVRSFKCGPDYIDPMFHTSVLGVPSQNLDLFFSKEEELRGFFARHAGGVNIVEGVMGYYDGMAMDSDRASAYHLAGVLDCPVILVVNVRGMALSAAAVVKGYQQFRPGSRIAGVIFNRCSEGSFERLKITVENECEVPVVGYLPTDPEISLESRYLGLITASEIEDLQSKMQRLAETAERTLDLDRILAIAQDAPDVAPAALQASKKGDFVLAVARDKAFCFYYEANLELLQALGARIVHFSPVEDRHLPDCDGLLLGGGYPELYADKLEANAQMRKEIRKAVQSGLPTIAECGGFMYLCRSIAGHAMCGVFDTEVENEGKLTRFGYASVRAQRENLLLAPGMAVKGHEFHYWDAGDPGHSLTAEKPSGLSWRCAYTSPTYYAGYPHLYLPSCPESAERFAAACLTRRGQRKAFGHVGSGEER